jgi:hypothetical protein
MTKERPTQTWVSEDFKNMLKAAAAKNGETILSYTAKIAKKNKENNNETIFPFSFK